MFFDDLLIRPDSNAQTVTLSGFLESPATILESVGDRVWVGSGETFEHIPAAVETVPLEAGIVQFHSDPIMQELLDVASPSVNAALGISGLTSISRPLIEAGLSSREYDLSREESALNVEFFLSLADRCDSWETVLQPGTSFRYFSSIPANESASDRKLLGTIRSLSDEQLTNGNPAGTAAIEIRAGLLLIHGFLEPSHQCSQSIEGEGPDRNGDYWHGIMHRREPDFGNSKYWFRRVGNHPCFSRLAEAARVLTELFHDPRVKEWTGKLTRSGWDSIAAVNFFEEAHQPSYEGTALHQFACGLQMQEMLILLAYCCRQCQRS